MIAKMNPTEELKKSLRIKRTKKMVAKNTGKKKERDILVKLQEEVQIWLKEIPKKRD